MTRLKLEISKTVNLGNYESTRVAVGVEEDIPPHKVVTNDLKDAWIEMNQEWLEEKLYWSLERMKQWTNSGKK